ncbi:MAG: tetratricopeptide repeat protein, partial [Blastocatellia bacterium]
YTIGFSHYLLAEYDKAVEPLKKYGELTAKSGKPVDQNARRALGRSYYFLGRNDEAVAILAETSTASTGFDTAAGDKDAGKDTGLDTDKDKAQAAANLKESAADSYYLGAIYFKQGDNDKAITALQAAVKDRADDIAPVELLTEALMKRAVSTKSKSDWLATAAAAEQLTELRDDLASASILGRAYFGAEDFDKAVPPLEKVARANATDGDAWVYYGIALSRSGQTRKAMEALEITIRLVPNSMPALAELGYIYESNKQYDQALRIYQKAYEATGSSDDNIKASIDRVKALAASQH